MISQKETEREVNLLFEKFTSWNQIEIKVIMTDDFYCYHKLIRQYFPNTSHILCIWHVYRAWNRKLKKIFGTNLSSNIFHKLVQIQRILDPIEFQCQYEQFLNLSNAVLRDYLTKNYSNRVQQWAACYRKYMNINVNMYIESMHKLLKRKYLKGIFFKSVALN